MCISKYSKVELDEDLFFFEKVQYEMEFIGISKFFIIKITVKCAEPGIPY